MNNFISHYHIIFVSSLLKYQNPRFINISESFTGILEFPIIIKIKMYCLSPLSLNKPRVPTLVNQAAGILRGERGVERTTVIIILLGILSAVIMHKLWCARLYWPRNEEVCHNNTGCCGYYSFNINNLISYLFFITF